MPAWETRDIVGHLIDVTESYFTGFDAAHSGAAVADALGVRVMQDRLDAGAKEHRGLSQAEAVERLRTDFAKMMEICAALGPDEWGGLLVAHSTWGRCRPSSTRCSSSWTTACTAGTSGRRSGRAHSLLGDTADLLAPFMFILWQATADVPVRPGGVRGRHPPVGP